MIAADFLLRSLGYNGDFTVQLGASVRKLRGRSFTVTGCVSLYRIRLTIMTDGLYQCIWIRSSLPSPPLLQPEKNRISDGSRIEASPSSPRHARLRLGEVQAKDLCNSAIL